MLPDEIPNSAIEYFFHIRILMAMFVSLSMSRNSIADVDRLFYADDRQPMSMDVIIEAMCAYADRHIASGGRLSHVTRHMVGLFNGQPGARRWRQILSTDATRQGANSAVLRTAYAAIEEARANAA